MSNLSEINGIQLKPYKQGFWRGYEQIRTMDRAEIRNKLFDALEISEGSPAVFSDYLRGLKELKASKAQAVEIVFAQYGITDVWGRKQS
jgi:hypothetical protein